MYKNFLIVASKQDKAGMNIANQLSQFIAQGNFKFHLIDGSILENENLDMEKINRYDFVIFASKHLSKNNEKSICLHTPGNWGEAKTGGRERKISQSSAIFMKQLFEKLNENQDKFTIKHYQITMEATHHGPLIEKPCCFIEIGSTESEWKDRKAGFMVAKTLLEVMQNFKENPYNEIAFAIGGPHYCPTFNKVQLKSNVAIAHVIPQHALPLTEEMVKEALNKTEEEVDFAVLDWKGMNATERQQVIEVLDKMYVRYVKASEVNKRN